MNLIPQAGPKIAYFAPDVSQGSVRKRITCFLDSGATLTSYTFRKRRPLGHFEPSWSNVELGVISHGRYLSRIATYAVVLWRLLLSQPELRQAQAFYARNLDCAVLALIVRALTNRRAAFFYEVPDIRAIMVDRRSVGAAARSIERFVLRWSDCLVTPSPSFLDHYFIPYQGYRDPVFILENRIYAHDMAPYLAIRSRAKSACPRAPGVVTVGWFGVLDCPNTWAAIKKSSAALGSRVQFYLRGYPEGITDDVIAFCAQMKNVRYDGPFDNRSGLAEMYEAVDVVLGVDLMSKEGNSWWLLPNSLYEAGAHCRPLITTVGTATAQRVQERNSGWSLEEPFGDALEHFLATFNWGDWAVKVARLAETDPAEFVGQAEFGQLMDRIKLAAPRTDPCVQHN